ncbi:MAG: tetratricopeptide repeat protein [Terriglobia bacterium]
MPVPSPKHSTAIGTVSWRGLLAVALGAAMLLGVGPARAGQGRAAASAAVRQAQADFDSGRPGAAIGVLKPWLLTHPEDAGARVLLGTAEEATDDFESAETEFQLALKLEPRNSQALAALGALYDHSHHPEKAEPLLAQAVKISPSSPKARLAWAAVLTELHRYPEAAGALRAAHAPQATNEKIAYLRLKASVALGTGGADEAARDMESALALAPGNSNLRLATGIAELQARHWNSAASLLASLFRATQNPRVGLYLLEGQINAHGDYSSTLEELRKVRFPPGETGQATQEAAFHAALGRVLSNAGLEAEAVKDFEAAVRDAPGSPELYLDLASAQLQAGLLDAALASAQHAQALQDTAAAESLLGDIQEKRGRSLEAVHRYQKAVSLDPESERYWMALGIELLRHETYKPALSVFEQAATRFPSSLRIHVALGITQYFLEHYHEAIHALMAASRIKPNSPLAFDFLAEIQLQQQVTPEPDAVHAVCQYAGAHPRRGDAMAYCGALLARAGHDRGDAAPPPAALWQLRAAARLAPQNATARCELGKTLEWAKQWREAQAQMQACVRLEPGSAEGHYRLAEIYRRLGEVGLAQQQMKLHDEAVKQMVASNAQHDATLRKFLYTIGGTTPRQASAHQQQ